MMKRSLFYLVLISIASVFIYTGITKGFNVIDFYWSIRAYEILPVPLAKLTAWFLPVLEVVSGIALLVPKSRQAASMILGGAMIVFIVAILSVWARGMNIDCGCFGNSGESSNYVWVLTRDAFLMAGIVWVYVSTLTLCSCKAEVVQSH